MPNAHVGSPHSLTTGDRARGDIERQRQVVVAEGADEYEGGYGQDGAAEELRPLAALRVAAEEADEAAQDHQEVTSGTDQDEQQVGPGQVAGAQQRPESVDSSAD